MKPETEWNKFMKEMIVKLNLKDMTGEYNKANINVVGVGSFGRSLCNLLNCMTLKDADILFVDKDNFDAVKMKNVMAGSDMTFVCTEHKNSLDICLAKKIAEIGRSAGATDSTIVGIVIIHSNIQKIGVNSIQKFIRDMAKLCSSVVIVQSDIFEKYVLKETTSKSFSSLDFLLATVVKYIVEMITVPSLVGLDFADVKAVLDCKGIAVLSVGESDTENRVEEAVKRALLNPLLDVNIKEAKGVLIHVTGGSDLTLDDVNKAVELVIAVFNPNIKVARSAKIQDNMSGKIRVMTIITGLKSWTMDRIKRKSKKKK